VPETQKIPGLILVEHEMEAPLRHADPGGPRIKVFAREVRSPGGEDKPLLVFLQGGPGVEAPRPTARPWSPGFLERALEDYRVLMLDQRGTGRSTPVGTLDGMTAEDQAAYLECFRADSIVADAELLRKEMGVEQWSVLGQSFGGFCVMHYLSTAPESLREAFFTGGLAPVGRHPDEVYRATYSRVRERCRRYYDRFPADRERVVRIHEWIASEEVVLPGGDRLTPGIFRQLGLMLGMSTGADRLHYILELPVGSPAFLHDLEQGLPGFERNPLYAIIHEASYADGGITNWSAARVEPEEFKSHPELFTGEHVYPWMFADYGALRPLAAAANMIAAHDWPRLYEAERLSACTVPSAALVYAEDMYVESVFSEETAALIPSLRMWLTNEYDHNGLREDGKRILDRLITLAREG